MLDQQLVGGNAQQPALRERLHVREVVRKPEEAGHRLGQRCRLEEAVEVLERGVETTLDVGGGLGVLEMAAVRRL